MAVCASCGVESPAGFRFCGGCGAALAAPAPDRRERRVVSVLFADLVGFTSRSEQLDVEDVDGLLAGYHRLLRRELERHGGTVEKFIGDAVMALFGAPVAHEDDAERAVRAGLAIQTAVDDLRRRDDVDLHVRVGVTTGEALVVLGANPAAGEGMATGDVVNTAARLQSAAPVDGVLVDEQTYRLTDRSVRFEPADAVVAKGKTEPVPVWRAIDTRSLVPEQTRADDLPLVGRADEAGLLVGALNRSQREPSTQLVTVLGAPGIGKTRLVEELGNHVEDMPGLVRWRRGRSLAYGSGVALWALGEIVKAQAGILESDSATVATEKLQVAVSAVTVEERDRVWVARHLRPLVGLESGAETSQEGQVEAFAAWRRFFEALAEESPTVLVFEDLHWADDALLDFVDVLADRAGSVPLLIVCTARPDLLERRPAWGGGKINAQTINLPPLTTDDTARLVAELLGQALLPADTQAALLERAEGNPLYAQEFVRMLRDRGLLVRDGGGWTLTGEPEGLPETVQAIIAARLDTLSDAERAFVQDAAVVGRTAWIGATCALGERARTAADDLLHVLERKQLLRRSRRSSVEGDVEFAFAHALTQEVAYGQIRRADRAEKHERAAEWIARISTEREDRAELLAHHYATALELRAQTGGAASDLVAKTRDAHAEAGRQAQAVSAHLAAERHLAAALELTNDGRRLRLLLEHAVAASDAGSAQWDSLEAALDAQLAAEDWESAAVAARLCAVWLEDEGRGIESDAMLAQAKSYADRSEYIPAATEIAQVQAYRLLIGGRTAEALGVTGPALHRAEVAGDEVGSALMLGWDGDARFSSGDATGLDQMRESVAALAARGSRFEFPLRVNLAENLVGLGDLASASSEADAAARAAGRFGTGYQVASASMVCAHLAYHRGDWGSALALTGASATSETVRWSADVLGGATHAMILLAGGAVAWARAMGQALVSYADRARNEEAFLHGLSVLAAAAGLDGDAGSCATACQQFLDRWLDIGGMANVTAALAQVAAMIPDAQNVTAAAGTVIEGSRWRPAFAAMAERRYADAANIYAEIGSLTLEASARLRAAATTSGAESAGQAERALAFYSRVGATAYAEQARQQLRRSA